jgi:ABC-2 type transport system permease protein
VLDEPTVAMDVASRRAFLDTIRAVPILAFIALALASGMFVPLDQMPGFLRSIARLLFTYHHAQLAWGAIGAANKSAMTSVSWLTAYAVALFGLAAWAYRRDSLCKCG